MYIEYVFLENFIVDFFIISCTAKVLNEKSSLYILGALLGSIVAVLCPLFTLDVLTSLVIKIFTSLMVCCLCFKMKSFKRGIFSYLIFMMTTFIFGGATELLKQSFGQLTILMVLISGFSVFVLLKTIIKFLNRKRVVDSFSTKVVIIDGSKKIEEVGYYDTGNLLYDPITSKPICLITHEVFSRLYGGDLVSLFLKKVDEKSLKNGHYISINSAVKSGEILVFCVDKLIIFDGNEEREFNDACLGLSFSGFEKAMHSKVLLHSSQI